MSEHILPTPSTLTVEELDGTPTVQYVQTIKVTNGTLTDNGDGSVSIDTGGAGTGGHTIEDEGTPLTARTNLNFVGTGVAATDDALNNASVVTINKWYPLGNGSSSAPSLIFAAGAPIMVEQLT